MFENLNNGFFQNYNRYKCRDRWHIWQPRLEIQKAGEAGSHLFSKKATSKATQYRMKTLFCSLFCVYFVLFPLSLALTLSESVCAINMVCI